MWLLLVLALMTAGCDVVFGLKRPNATDAAAPNIDANLVFITSATHDGNFNGLAGADAFCQSLATAAGLDGSYLAWLSSDEPVNAIDRLHGSRGWVRPDGQPVADLSTDLGIRGPLVPIAITEGGDDVRGLGLAWTGTLANGTKANARVCASWGSADSNVLAQIGDPSQGGGQFTQVPASTVDRCNDSNRLYCFGTGKTTELVLPPPTDPIMFVSDQLWLPTGGITSADAVCTQEAADAKLPGTYQAALATGTQPIAARFSTNHDYVRVDGVRIGTALTAARIDTFVNLTATGKAVAGDTTVWTGGLPGAAGGNQTCNDWAGGTGSVGIIGEARATDGTAFLLMSASCSAHRIYCLAI